MAHELETVKIINPDKPDDYIVIAKSDFRADTMNIFRPKPATQAAVGPERTEEHPDAAAVAEALDLSVAKLGPWIASQDSVERLERMLALETRKSAKALIEARIEALSEDE